MKWNGSHSEYHPSASAVQKTRITDTIYSPGCALRGRLLDSKTTTGNVMAFLNPVRCRIEIGVSKEDAANARRGAQPTIVIDAA
jgi:hypothetical protein